MKLLKRQTKPSGGYSAFLHVILTAIIPLLLFVLVRVEFVAVAFVVVLLSKWRMFAVKMRHWPANFRANAVDIFVGLSTVAFLTLSQSQALQLVWVAIYTAWLLFLKPQSAKLWVGVQALVAQTMALSAVFLVWSKASETALTCVVWAITYLSARHFLNAFDESMSRASSYVWAFFCASLTWLSAHWLLYYGVIAQPVLLITIIGYGLAALYYLEHTERLKPTVRRQFIIVTISVVLLVLLFSDWSGDII